MSATPFGADIHAGTAAAGFRAGPKASLHVSTSCVPGITPGAPCTAIKGNLRRSVGTVTRPSRGRPSSIAGIRTIVPQGYPFAL